MRRRLGVAALPRPDFIARPSAARRAAFGLLGASVLWLGFVSADALALREQVEQAAAEHARWERQRTTLAARQARLVAAPVPDDLRRKAWRLSESLNYPWGGTLAKLENATPDGVRWLVLEIDRERDALRLEGLASDTAPALQAADALAALPGLSDVVLTRLAAVEPVVGKGQRFEVDARIGRALAGTPGRAPEDVREGGLRDGGVRDGGVPERGR